MELGPVLAPERLHAQDVLASDGAPAAEIDPVVLRLRPVPAESDSYYHPAGRQVVQRRDLLGQEDRVVLGDEQHPRAQPDPSGRRRGGRQTHHRVEAPLVVVEVHPLDEPGRDVGTERQVGVLGEEQRREPPLLDGDGDLVGRHAAIGQKDGDPQLHGGISWLRARRTARTSVAIP